MSEFAPLQARRRLAVEPLRPARASSIRQRTTSEVAETGPAVGVAVDPWTEMAEILVAMLAPQVPGADGDAAPVTGFVPGITPSETSPDAVEAIEDAPPTGETPVPVPLDPARPPAGDPAFELLAGGQGVPATIPVETPDFPTPRSQSIPTPTGAAGTADAAVVPAPVPSEPEQPDADSGSPQGIVARWQSGVAGAGGAMPKRRLEVPAGLAADLSAAKTAATTRNAQAREGLVDEAKKVVPKAPVVDDPPPPPPENPIPDQTSAILAASGKRLPDQSPPGFGRSPPVVDVQEPFVLPPAEPVARDRPVPSDLFQVLITPGADKIAQIDPAAKDAHGNPTPEARQVERALEQLAGTGGKEAPQERGEPVTFQDLGPQPAAPLPEGLQIPVGQVVARLLARTDDTASGVLDRLREQAYPKGVLKTEFPDIGAGLLGALTTEVGTELADIAAAAGIAKNQLAGMIDERRAELAASSDSAAKDADAAGKSAAEAVRDEGQQTADGVASAAKAAEEETLRRQEAAGGATDPTVIDRRRDLVMDWVREQVTVQTSNYQHAGEQRVGELNQARIDMIPACIALVQRLTYRIMTPMPGTDGRKPRDPGDLPRERRLADDVNVLQVWQDGETKRIGEEVRLAVKLADTATRANRTAVEAAGDRALAAARQWALDRVLDGKGFWDRFVALVTRWLSDADHLTEQWRVRRTVENRNAVAGDLLAVDAARKRLAAGMKQEEILADQSLSEAQRLVIQQYFAQPPGANPLDFAATRLESTIAADHLDAVRPLFEQELIATPVAEHDYATAEKLNHVAQAMDGGFDGAKIAQQVHGAMDQIGTDEELIFSSLRGLSSFGGMVVRKFYTAMFGGSLDADLDDELSDNTFSAGGDLSRARAELEGKVALGDALALHEAMAGPGTDEKAIMALLRGKTPEEVEAIRADYLAKFGETLDSALADDLGEGNEIDQASALIAGDTATADAIALDEAMRGGIISSGTDEAEIERVQTSIRDEVMAKAKSEHWSAQQAEAEVRRRMKAVEDRFGDRYRNVEQYNEPGLTGGSVLKRAFSSELSGAELDLANALQDNDLIAADAARIEIERDGIYASDEKLVKVMRSQYERALEARRLDEGPARQMRIEREVDRWLAQTPPLSAEEISRKRIAFERQMDKELDEGAQKDSKLSTEALRSAYEGKYNQNLAYTLAFYTQGVDSEIALKLLKQGGKLTPLQEIDYATKGDGTDEDMLRKTFASLTKAEIEQVRSEWEARHPGEDFYAMLRSELSGRDESDIMDMAYHGAPESAKERIAQEQRRVDRERDDLTGVVGGSVAGSEDAWMAYQLKELQALEARLDDKPKKGEKDQRLALLDKVDFQVQRVQDAVEDHRRRIDSVTDAVTQVASIVAAVVVGAVVTVLTAGTMGPAAIAAVVALSSSLAATITTMATKRLILGGAYGMGDVGVDLAVGVVDAVVSVATAGMGDKLMKGFSGLVKKLPVAKIAGVVGKSGVVGAVTKSGIATKVLETKGLGTILRLAGKALPESAEEGVARFLTTSSHNVLQSIPSTLTGALLNDQTWKGDPLMNLVESGGMGMWQAFYMGHLLALPSEGLHHATEFAVGKVQTHINMGSEVGRLKEAGRLFHEGYTKYQQSNRGASMGDFLVHPEGRKLRAELNAKGLLPTVESVARKLAANPDVRTAEGFDPSHPDSVRKAADLRQAQLTAALPDTAGPGTFVTPDPELTGNAVHVEPLRIGDKIVGVDVRVGPDATPLDVALHGATIDAMQKYTGLAGSIRKSLNDAVAGLAGSGTKFGSAGWEARYELAKLPAIIDAKIEALIHPSMTAEARAKAVTDFESLDRQFHEHKEVLENPALGKLEGKGYIAAEDGKGSRKRADEALGPSDTAILYDKLKATDPPPGLSKEQFKAFTFDEVGFNEVMRVLDDLSAKTGIPHERLVQRAEIHHGGEEGRGRVGAKAEQRIAITEKRIGEVRDRLDLRKKQPLLASYAIELNKVGLELEKKIAIEEKEMAADRAKRKGEKIPTFADFGVDPPPLIGTEPMTPGDTAPPKGFGLSDDQLEDIGPLIKKMLDRAKSKADRREAAGKVMAELHGALRGAGIEPTTDMLNKALVFAVDHTREQHQRKGRRTKPKATVDSFRGRDGVPDLEGFVLDSVLAENIKAMDHLREHWAKLNPDITFGVREGGAVLLEVLAPEGEVTNPAKGKPDISKFQIVEKEESGKRTVDLKDRIEKAIAEKSDPPKRSFAIIDSYMGGIAAREFMYMFRDIVNAHPTITGLHLELLWLRETHGFERLVIDVASGDPIGITFEAQRKVPEHFEEIIEQTPVPVRIVLGDDMNIVYKPNEKEPIYIFDAKGQIIQKLKPPVAHPKTGKMLESTRAIMIALMKGAWGPYE